MQPIEFVENNTPPQVMNTAAPDGDVIILEREDQAIWVVVEDDAPEYLEFTWILEYEGVVPDAESNQNYSQITLDPLEDNHGLQLDCQITDYGTDPTNTTVLSWTLEVL